MCCRPFEMPPGKNCNAQVKNCNARVKNRNLKPRIANQ